MHTGKFRIVEVADGVFMVEELRMEPRTSGWFGWGKRYWVEHWERTGLTLRHGTMLPICERFHSQQDAQKWIDDKRKYPIVVKDNA